MKDFSKDYVQGLLKRVERGLCRQREKHRELRSHSKFNTKKMLSGLKVELKLKERTEISKSKIKRKARERKMHRKKESVGFMNAKLQDLTIKKTKSRRTRKKNKKENSIMGRNIYFQDKNFENIIRWKDNKADILEIIAKLEKEYGNTLSFVNKMLMKIKSESKREEFTLQIDKINRISCNPKSKKRGKKPTSERVVQMTRVKNFTNERVIVDKVGGLLADLNKQKFNNKKQRFERENTKFKNERKVLEKKIFFLKETLNKIQKVNSEEINLRIVNMKQKQRKKQRIFEESNKVLRSIFFDNSVKKQGGGSLRRRSKQGARKRDQFLKSLFISKKRKNGFSYSQSLQKRSKENRKSNSKTQK